MPLSNEQLAGLAGGVGGFAEAFLAAARERQAREDAQAKWLAYLDLQRQLMGAKKVTGQELIDYATTLLGIPGDDPRLKQVRPEKEYNSALGERWLNNLTNIVTTKEKVTGAETRERMKRNAPKPKGGLTPKAFDPISAQEKILGLIAPGLGFKKGTTLKTLFKNQEEAERTAKEAMELARSRLRSVGQEEFFNVNPPFKMTKEPGWFETATYEWQPMFVPKKPSVSATDNFWDTSPNIRPTPLPTPVTRAPGIEPTPVLTPDVVGAERRKKLIESFIR